MSITDTLNDRENKYGSFGDLANGIQALKSMVRSSAAYPRMTSVQREASEMIVMKLCRIMYGDPMHFDSWRDIAGYAALAVEEFSPRADGSTMEAAPEPKTPMELLRAVAAE